MAVEHLADLQERIDRAKKSESEDKPQAVPPIDWDELTGDPPPRSWWIQDWLGPWPTLTAGAGGAGKTRLWQTLCTSLVVGKPYLATAVRGMRTLTWSCEEDKDEVWRNQAAVNRHLDLTMSDLMGLSIVPRLGLDNTLLGTAFGQPTFTPLFEELREQVNDLKADVLVLDNIAQVYGGGVDPHQVTMFVNALAGLVRGRPFAPVLLGHVAKSAGSEFSGTMAWENAVRMRWFIGPTLPDVKLDEDDGIDPDVVYLAKRKANYTGKDWMRLKFQNGVLVPETPPDGGQRFDQSSRNDAAEIVLLAAFPKLISAGIHPSDSPNANDYLPKQIIAKGYHQNHTKKDLAGAMNRLMGTGRLKRSVIGKYPNRSDRFGLVIA